MCCYFYFSCNKTVVIYFSLIAFHTCQIRVCKVRCYYFLLLLQTYIHPHADIVRKENCCRMRTAHWCVRMCAPRTCSWSPMRGWHTLTLRTLASTIAMVSFSIQRSSTFKGMTGVGTFLSVM